MSEVIVVKKGLQKIKIASKTLSLSPLSSLSLSLFFFPSFRMKNAVVLQ